MVAVARSAPVGRPPLVLRIESVRFGVVPVHPEQKSWTSTFTSWPVTAGIKVCPPQLAVPKLVPVVVPAVFDWSRFGAFTRRTSPGLVVRSTLVATPVWKSAWVVSTGQALVGAVPSEKFCVVVLPSVMTMLVTVLELYPGALAVSLG